MTDDPSTWKFTDANEPHESLDELSLLPPEKYTSSRVRVSIKELSRLYGFHHADFLHCLLESILYSSPTCLTSDTDSDYTDYTFQAWIKDTGLSVMIIEDNTLHDEPDRKHPKGCLFLNFSPQERSQVEKAIFKVQMSKL